MLTTAITQRVAERELKNSRPQGDCIVSTVTLSRDGYRESKFQGRYVGMAHRIVYLAAGFEIPDDYTLDHLCRNRACLNIKHLEPVTLAENLIRARAHRAAELRARGHVLLPKVQQRGRCSTRGEGGRIMSPFIYLALLVAIVVGGNVWLSRQSRRNEPEVHESDAAFDTLPTNVRPMPGIPSPRTPSRWS